MTYDEIKSSSKPMLTPADICPVLGCASYTINVQARQDASRLGFPVNVMGSRVRIPRLAFIRWMEGTNEPADRNP